MAKSHRNRSAVRTADQAAGGIPIATHSLTNTFDLVGAMSGCDSVPVPSRIDILLALWMTATPTQRSEAIAIVLRGQPVAA